MTSQLDSVTYEDVHDDRGNLVGGKGAFSKVELVAEHVTEVHRTLENDHTVTEVELPGVVNVYYVIDGGRILVDQLSGSKVAEAIQNAQKTAAATKTK